MLIAYDCTHKIFKLTFGNPNLIVTYPLTGRSNHILRHAQYNALLSFKEFESLNLEI